VLCAESEEEARRWCVAISSQLLLLHTTASGPLVALGEPIPVAEDVLGQDSDDEVEDKESDPADATGARACSGTLAGRRSCADGGLALQSRP
jgi:hypothetical protein